MLDGSNQAVAKILSELRPGIDDGFSLAERIDWLGRQFTENKGVAVELVVTGASHKLPPAISTCVYRIYQEALDNIGRHANAKKVLTLLTVKDQSLFFVVDDDGDGFDLSLLKTTKTFGLFSTKERVLSLKGTFEVISETGKGTTITAIIPINEP